MSGSPPSHSPGSHLTLPSPSRSGKECKWNLLRLELFQGEQNLELCRKGLERCLGRHRVSKSRERYPPWFWKLGTQTCFVVFSQSSFPFLPQLPPPFRLIRSVSRQSGHRGSSGEVLRSNSGLHLPWKQANNSRFQNGFDEIRHGGSHDFAREGLLSFSSDLGFPFLDASLRGNSFKDVFGKN